MGKRTEVVLVFEYMSEEGTKRMPIDPVCGMTVEPAKAAGHAEHDGRERRLEAHDEEQRDLEDHQRARDAEAGPLKPALRMRLTYIKSRTSGFGLNINL